MAFFAIWWAWMNYTWFASAYDSGDVAFRLLTFAIMAGALLLATGIPELFATSQSVILVTGYALMRLAMAALWLRAARDDPGRRSVAVTYAVGIAVVQVLWVLRLALHDERLVLPTFIALVLAELAVPVVAERRRHTPFHPEHGAERAGAMTIIVLGEVVLASVVATQTALAGEGEGGGLSLDLVLLVIGAFLLVVSTWWLYFRRDHADLVKRACGVWAFGYLHYFVYAAIAAAGAGITAAVEVSTHDAHVAAQSIEWLLAAAVSICLVTLSLLHLMGGDGVGRTVGVAVAVSAVLLGIAAAGPTIGVSVLLMGVVLVGAVVVNAVWDSRRAVC